MNQLETIGKSLRESSPLITIMGAEHEKYVINVLNEIRKSMDDDKKDMSRCDIDSIVAAIKQAYEIQLDIDGRQHCHLVKYGAKVNLQIGYRGFIYAIKRAYPDANIDCQLVYKGDVFEIQKDGDSTTYSLKINSPFSHKKEDILGGFCFISYSLNGRMVSFCETMSIEEINQIKGKAKQLYIWNDWFSEKAKVAIIRRASKIHFAGLEQIQKIDKIDNESFDFSKSSEEQSDSVKQYTKIVCQTATAIVEKQKYQEIFDEVKMEITGQGSILELANAWKNNERKIVILRNEAAELFEELVKIKDDSKKFIDTGGEVA